MSNKAGPEICYVNYQKPDFETALKNCRASCQGPGQCRRNGWIFYEDYYFKCPLYLKHQEDEQIRQQVESSVPDLLSGAELEDYNPLNPSQKRARELSDRFLKTEAYKTGKGLVLTGDYGVGKTYLAVSIYKALIRKGIQAVFTRPKKHGSIQALEEYYETLQKPTVLIYDDLGTEIKREIIIDFLYTLVDRRMESNKSLIATTNLTKEALRHWLGKRIFSRLIYKNYILEVNGEDYRERNRQLF